MRKWIKKSFWLVFLSLIILYMIGRKSILFSLLCSSFVCAPPSHKRLNIVISLYKERKKENGLSLLFFLSAVKQKLNGIRETDAELCRTWFADKTIWQTSQTSNHWTKTTIVYLHMIIMWMYVIHKNLLPTNRSTKNQWSIQTTIILRKIKRLFIKCLLIMIQIWLTTILTGRTFSRLQISLGYKELSV
jgi:hypothetical protein